MNKKTILLGFTAGLLFANGIFANDPKTEKEDFDINSIVYIEDDMDFDLGFDTADYLPEDFNAHQVYFDLNSVNYIEEDFSLEWESKESLPKGFDAYAYPTDVQSINYIDEADRVVLDFNTKLYLPEGFDAHLK